MEKESVVMTCLLLGYLRACTRASKRETIGLAIENLLKKKRTQCLLIVWVLSGASFPRHCIFTEG